MTIWPWGARRSTHTGAVETSREDARSGDAPPAGIGAAIAMHGLSDADAALLDELARRIVQLHMASAAILFLETGKPLSFLGSQALIFAEPMVRAFFTVPRYADLQRLLEDRANVERLICCIEDREEERLAAERRARAERRAEKRRKM
jgi:hypothetical protein